MTKNTKSLYEFEFEDILTGQPIKLDTYRGKVLLVVNTASYCGFTPQFDDLEVLWKQYQDKDFVILGTPTNDFGQQDPKSNQDISEFCSRTYDVSFPLTRKIHLKGSETHPFYQWLYTQTGWLGYAKWNFHKFLFDKEGQLSKWYFPFTRPSSKKVITQIEKLL